MPPSHRPRASLQCTACGRSGGPGACAPAAAGGGPGAGCGPACPPSTAARPAKVPSCRLNSAVWPPARVSSAKGLLGRRCPAGWGGSEDQGEAVRFSALGRVGSCSFDHAWGDWRSLAASNQWEVKPSPDLELVHCDPIRRDLLSRAHSSMPSVALAVNSTLVFMVPWTQSWAYG